MIERQTEAVRHLIREHERMVLEMAASRLTGGLRDREHKRVAVERHREIILDDIAALVEAARKEVANG